jgi:hypothetical protein
LGWRLFWRFICGSSSIRRKVMTPLLGACIAWGALFIGLLGLLGWLTRR